MNHTDDILAIHTPENVIFNYRISGLGSRFLAALIDSLIIVMLQVSVILLMINFLLGQFFNGTDLASWAVALLILVAFLFLWGYYIFFELTWNGQSPGKRLVGIRVICRSGMPVRLSEVLIRNLVRILDFLPSFYGIGAILIFTDPLARRLGDVAAGTLVVHDTGALRLENLLAQRDSQPAAEQPDTDPPDFPLEKLSSASLQFLENYLERRGNLSNSPALDAQVLIKLYNQVGMPGHPQPEDPQEVLYALRDAARRRQKA